MNLESQMKPVEDTFNLLFRANQLESIYHPNPGVLAVNSKFETKVDGFNVAFEKISGQTNYTSYSVAIKDENKQELFKVNVVWSQPLFEMPGKDISMQILGKVVQDPEQISSLLKTSLFEQILDKVNNQSNEIIKEQERVAALSLKSSSELVSDVLDRINKIRPDFKSMTPHYGLKD